MRPLILATASTDAESYRTEYAVLGSPYIRAIEQPDATAFILTPVHATLSLEHGLDLAHGLVLTGGEDVSPDRYGEKPHPKLGTVNHARDEMEITVLRAALRRRLPVLAICRGMQLLNVALGGTLYQDLHDQLNGDLLHQQDASVNSRWHSARVESGSRLAEIFEAEDLHINSFHHQGIRDLAPDLRALARAEDGLIEAVEAPEYPWVFGVQWHPERGEAEILNDRRHPDRRLFRGFVEACRSFAEAEAHA
ncbi:gamma-glutamyl-gamma-aminobutyrate hydrolase family protein [soil metagenome]|nr:gamma-glutamyl-gamma-aminobutyrate hydrolase family protein [Gemmatimonadota bacterium]